MKIYIKKPKRWNTSMGAWQTDYIIVGILVFSKYEIVRGYPAHEYIIDRHYRLSVKKK